MAGGGSLDNRRLTSRGTMPQAAKPDLMFAGMFAAPFSSKPPNLSFGMVMFQMFFAAQSAFNLSKTSRHSRFMGAKTATSNGWVRWVEFGGRKMYLKTKNILVKL
jgi:hypothetical protein